MLAFPQTYMNDSGRAVQRSPAATTSTTRPGSSSSRTSSTSRHGRLQVKAGGGLAGHNGLRSIADHLHTHDFLRVRIGIGKPPGRQGAGANHVLSRPSKAMKTELDIAVQEAADAVEMIIELGVDRAINRFNTSFPLNRPILTHVAPLLDGYLQALRDQGGSDLHLRVGGPPRIRVNGILLPIDGAPRLTEEDTESIAAEIVRPHLVEGFARSDEADFAYSLAGGSAASGSTPSASAAPSAWSSARRHAGRDARASSACPPGAAASPTSRAAWCWSPARRVRARRRRSPA